MNTTIVSNQFEIREVRAVNPPTQRSTIETLAILFAISLTYTGAAAESPRILWSVDWGADGKLFAVSGEKSLWIYDADSFAWIKSGIAL